MRYLLVIFVLLFSLSAYPNKLSINKNVNQKYTSIPPTDTKIKLMGRFEAEKNGSVLIGYPGVTISMRTISKSVILRAKSSTNNNYLTIIIDGKFNKIIRLEKHSKSFILTDDKLPQRHHIQLVNRSESWHGLTTIENFIIEEGHLLDLPLANKKRMMFIGDSVTCGEAIERKQTCNKNSSWWDPERSYGMLIAQKFDAEVHLICAGGRGLIRSWNGKEDQLNAPDFFERTRADHSNSDKWDHTQYTPDLIVISLGTNDFNLGIGPLPKENRYVSAYVKFIRRIFEVHPNAKVVLTDGSLVNDMGDPDRPQKTVLLNYLSKTKKAINSDSLFIIPSNYYSGDSCDPHPTKSQHFRMATDFLPELRKLMKW